MTTQHAVDLRATVADPAFGYAPRARSAAEWRARRNALMAASGRLAARAAAARDTAVAVREESAEVRRTASQLMTANQLLRELVAVLD